MQLGRLFWDRLQDTARWLFPWWKFILVMIFVSSTEAGVVFFGWGAAWKRLSWSHSTWWPWNSLNRWSRKNNARFLGLLDCCSGLFTLWFCSYLCHWFRQKNPIEYYVLGLPTHPLPPPSLREFASFHHCFLRWWFEWSYGNYQQ